MSFTVGETCRHCGDPIQTGETVTWCPRCLLEMHLRCVPAHEASCQGSAVPAGASQPSPTPGPVPGPPPPPGPDAAFARFAAAHPGLSAIAGWTVYTVLRPPDVAVESGWVEVCSDVREPTGERPFLGIVRTDDGGVDFVLSALVPEGPGGRWFMEAFDASGGSSRQGPMPPHDADEWMKAVVVIVGGIVARRGGPRSPGRVRAPESEAFVRFARAGHAPLVDSWVVGRVLDDREVPCAGGRIELWSSLVVGGGQFHFPHMAAGFNRDGSILAIVAAELMPGVHDQCYLGMFDGEGHRNLGADRDWTDPATFAQAAVDVLSGLLQRSGAATDTAAASPLETPLFIYEGQVGRVPLFAGKEAKERRRADQHLVVVLGSGGMMRRLGTEERAVSWDHVVRVRESTTRHTVNGVPQYTEYHHFVGLADGGEWRFEGRLQAKAAKQSEATRPTPVDGRVVPVTIEQLGRIVQTQVTNRQLPLAVQQLREGKTLTFGPLSISATAITKGDQTVPWSDVVSIRVQQGVVAFKLTTRWRKWGSVMVGQIPNVYVVAALSDMLAAGGGSEP